MHAITVNQFTANVQWSKEVQQRHRREENIPAEQFGNRPFPPYVHQKSVNTGQIIPVFTIVCDHDRKSKREKNGRGFAAKLFFFGCPCAFSKPCEDP
jgi:hypothetical protein